MRELKPYERLSEDDPLRSPSGRCRLGYDSGGIAVVTVFRTGEVLWRAGDRARGAAGRLLLGDGGAVQVEDAANETVWVSDIALPGAASLTVNNRGELELCDGPGMPVFNSRTGPTGMVAVYDAAPAAEITPTRYLVREHKWRRLVTREPDGSLRISATDTRTGHGVTRQLTGPLVPWLEQDGTVLTWRLIDKLWSLCLADADGGLLWHEHMRDDPVIAPPPAPAPDHADRGPEPGEDFTSWLKLLIDSPEPEYCVSVVHDVAPLDALSRLGVEPRRIRTGTWRELREHSLREELSLNEGIVAAFALGPHTLVVEDSMGASAAGRPELSEGTFAASFCRWYLDTCFVVRRDGAIVAGEDWDGGTGEGPDAPEVRRALAAMGSDDLMDTAEEHGVELVCRAAGVRPTAADVAGTAPGAIVAHKR
ncbi:DUF6461 domain-containing protein [Streptomyces armeniacus]|uniref:DUF6461 domain-containing protein n=1 Tax=Streptomyces armeniacus TaxID=83291 RepID=UPI001AD83E0C|nr:DUF6461 domain-containing protein [Streptomyces armeniacus]